MKRVVPTLLVVASLCATIQAFAEEEDPAPRAPELVAQLRAFIAKNIPKGSPLGEDNNFARQLRERDDHFDYARPLTHFGTTELLAIVYWAPGAGAPGKVLEDIRVVHEPGKGFSLGSLRWVANYRKRHPLSMDTLSDKGVTSYLEELAAVVPRADRWGFRITSLKREAKRRFRITYDEPRRMNGFKTPEPEVVEFTETGAVRRFPFLQRKHL